MQFSGFIEASNSSTSAQQVFDLLLQATSSIGYEKLGLFALAVAGGDGQVSFSGAESPIIICNYPDEFRRRYEDTRLGEIDPLLTLAQTNLSPLVWEDVVGRMRLSEEQQQLCREREAAGLHDEISCPIHGPDGHTFALRFALGRPGACDRTHLSALQVLAIHFYYAFTRHWKKPAPPPSPPKGLQDTAQLPMPATGLLAKREQECLLWTARGKSASSISVILGLSENTVNFYVKNAMKKLGTTNRVVAVVLAVRAGLIKP